MGYDRGDSFPFDFDPNGIPFGAKSKGKLSPRSYLIQYERKWIYSFLSVYRYHRIYIEIFPVYPRFDVQEVLYYVRLSSKIAPIKK